MFPLPSSTLSRLIKHYTLPVWVFLQVVSLHLLSRLLPDNPTACIHLLPVVPGGPAATATAEASPPLPPPPLAYLLRLLRDWVPRTRFMAACCLTHLATAPAASSTDGSSWPVLPQMGRAKAAALSVLLRLLSEPGILELVPPVLARLLENR